VVLQNSKIWWREDYSTWGPEGKHLRPRCRPMRQRLRFHVGHVRLQQRARLDHEVESPRS
jgi:hypothetical protein